MCIRDRLKDKSRLLPFLAELAREGDFTAIVPISATRGAQLDSLLAETRKHLPKAQFLFGEDEITDRSERFLAAEYIREKLFRLIGDELPYAATVEVEKFAVEGGDGSLRRISAAIVVDRAGHKAGSYTHLDVYKRQIMVARCNWCTRCQWPKW